LLGHEHKSLSYRVYSEGAQVRPLYDAICKVDYGIDLSALYVDTSVMVDRRRGAGQAPPQT
jgi:hypothetical protein